MDSRRLQACPIADTLNQLGVGGMKKANFNRSHSGWPCPWRPKGNFSKQNRESVGWKGVILVRVDSENITATLHCPRVDLGSRLSPVSLWCVWRRSVQQSPNPGPCEPRQLPLYNKMGRNSHCQLIPGIPIYFPKYPVPTPVRIIWQRC